MPHLSRVIPPQSLRTVFATALLLITSPQLTQTAAAQPTSPTDPLALLETHCVKCHGGEKTKGGLDLTTREALLRGGENGAAIVLNKPDEGLLLQTIRHQIDPHMPHKTDKLPDPEIARIAEWVKAGSPYARPLNKGTPLATSKPAEFTVSEADRKHWAFQPVRRPTPPAVSATTAIILNPIDAFIVAKLQTAGLTQSPPAPRAVLIRRVTFDLIGLPPTPTEVDAFLSDGSPDAYEKLIDRLLDSPHYGECWGRHWLDLARFAETDGFEHDAVRPHAWRYRDYVIRSFNADKPYDRFIQEQLAGDELWPDDPDARIATGFNLLGPDMVDNADQQRRRHDQLNDMTDTTALALLGLTMGCARCHDHKFEPISQRDYYSLQAFFAPAGIVRDQPVATPSDRAVFEKEIQRYNEHPTVKELAALEAPAIDKLWRRKVAKLPPEAQSAHLTPPDERTTEQANLVLETEAMVQVPEKEIPSVLSEGDKARRVELLDAIKKLPKPPKLPLAMALSGFKNARTYVLNRGEYSQPGDEVQARFPTVLVDSKSASPATGRRAALANWLTDPRNPLTARVMVNRIWQHHFGGGLVPTPSDFGTHGLPPSHPELLDWLADEFMSGSTGVSPVFSSENPKDHGRDARATTPWSLKQMHKLMLMSATYRQSSTPTEHNGRRIDPDNRLYWHMNHQRLEGEVLRDSLLSISGRLNPEMGGPGVYPPLPEDAFKGATGWATSPDPRQQTRRSVYIFARRNLRFPFLEVFDAPDSNLSCPARERSTTAPQALTLLNADEVMQAAKATAKRMVDEASTDEERIRMAYRLTLGRAPNEKELAMTREFLQRSPFSEFCRALFNLNEFVYVE